VAWSGCTNVLVTIARGNGRSRRSKPTATPQNSTPPPRAAQNRSGCSSAVARSRRPSAVTTSMASNARAGRSPCARVPPDAAAQQIAADANRAAVSERERETVARETPRQVEAQRSGPGGRGRARTIDLDGVEVRDVDEQTAVTERCAAPGMTSAPDSQAKPVS